MYKYKYKMKLSELLLINYLNKWIELHIKNIQVTFKKTLTFKSSIIKYLVLRSKHYILDLKY